MSFEAIQNQPHPITKRYRLEFLGQGAENLVYSVKDRPNLVFKGNKLALAKALDWNASHGQPSEEDTEGVEGLRTGMLAQQRASYKILRECFGAHVPEQHQYLLSVPYTTSVLKELRAIADAYNLNIPSEGEGSSWTIVTAQRRVAEMNDWHRVSLRWSPVGESQPLSRMLADEHALRTEKQSARIEQRLNGTALQKILERAKKDPRFAEALTDFQKRAVAYAHASQTILDLVGNDNVLFTKKADGSWDYLLVDALFPFGDRILERAREALARNSAQLPQREEDKEAIIQALSFARTINALGAFLGTGAFIEIFPQTKPPNPFVASTQEPARDVAKKPRPAKGGLFGPIPNFRSRERNFNP